MTDVRVDRLVLRLAARPGRDGRRLAEAVGTALASLSGITGPFAPSTLRLRLTDDGTGTDEALASRIATELLRAAGQGR